MKDLIGCYKKVGFYSELDEKPLENYEQKRDTGYCV